MHAWCCVRRKHEANATRRRTGTRRSREPTADRPTIYCGAKKRPGGLRSKKTTTATTTTKKKKKNKNKNKNKRRKKKKRNEANDKASRTEREKRQSSAGFRRARERDYARGTAGGARRADGDTPGKRKGEGEEGREEKKKGVIVVTPARLLSRGFVVVSELVSRQNYVCEQASSAQLRLTAQPVHTHATNLSHLHTPIYRGFLDAIRLVRRRIAVQFVNTCSSPYGTGLSFP